MWEAKDRTSNALATQLQKLETETAQKRHFPLHICIFSASQQTYSTEWRDLWVILTEDCSSRDWFLIYPEGHLGEDYCHDAGDIRLNHEVAHFPLQVEVHCHHHVFTWRIAIDVTVGLFHKTKTDWRETVSTSTENDGLLLVCIVSSLFSEGYSVKQNHAFLLTPYRVPLETVA